MEEAPAPASDREDALIALLERAHELMIDLIWTIERARRWTSAIGIVTLFLMAAIIGVHRVDQTRQTAEIFHHFDEMGVRRDQAVEKLSTLIIARTSTGTSTISVDGR